MAFGWIRTGTNPVFTQAQATWSHQLQREKGNGAGSHPGLEGGPGEVGTALSPPGLGDPRD